MSALATSPAVSGTVVSAKVINPDPEEKDWGVGNIEITTSKAKKVVVAKDHTCAKPKVSAHSDVGWTVWMDRDPSNTNTQHSGEILRVRQARRSVEEPGGGVGLLKPLKNQVEVVAGGQDQIPDVSGPVFIDQSLTLRHTSR